MDTVVVPSKSIHDLIAALVADKSQSVVGVVHKGSRFAYEALDSADQACLDYDETILPPKKYLLPVNDIVLTYKTGDQSSVREVHDHSNRVIVGVHPADLAAIALLDKVHFAGNIDTHYATRRSHTKLVGIYPTRAYYHRFSSSMIEDQAYSAADLMLVDLDNGTFAVEIVTPAGTQLLWATKTSPATADDLRLVEARKHAVHDQVSVSTPVRELPKLLAGREKDRVFELRAQKCFSCGSCVLVCPTCYCFDVKDEVDLSLAEGTRVRTWDGCTLNGFAEVAGSHNFRKTPADRLRHRIFRKGKYLPEKFGMPGCVGCGRCSAACTAGIASPAEVFNELNGKGA